MALTDNLIHYRKLDETTGATTILNSVNATGEGTVSNVTWAMGKINNGAGFNGSSSGIDLGNPADLSGLAYNTAFTVSGWVKTSTSSAYHIILGRDGGGSATQVQYRLMIEPTTNKIAWAVGNGTTITGLGSAITDGKRHHVVGVCTGSALLTYVDGVYVGTGDYSTNTYNTNTYIGRRSNGLYATANIDEVAVRTRALSATEATDLYNGGQGMTYDSTKAAFVPAPLTNNLLAYYKLDSDSNDSLGLHNGTDTSISYANAGKIGNCATQNANTDGINLGTGLDGKAAFSISSWIYKDVDSYQWYFGTHSGVNNPSVGCYILNLKPHFFVGSTSDGDYAIFSATTTTIPTTTWTHIVWTYNGGTDIKLYINGVYTAITSSGAGTPTTMKSGLTAFLGRYGNQAGDDTYSFVGRYDEVGLWSRVLTASEVSSLYNSGNGLAYPLTSGVVKALVVAGGASGGDRFGAGGGAGGLVYDAAHTLTSQAYTVTVGDGGTAVTGVGSTRHQGNDGANSVFDTITALGGGGGAAYGVASGVGRNGGSGGGGAYNNGAAGTATQGNSGGGLGYGFAGGANVANLGGGGGGGTGAVGSPSTTASGQPSVGGVGGVGRVNPITGSTAGQNVTGTYYLAGGGGGSSTAETTVGVAGGYGGGGAGARGNDTPGGSGTANTGGGGGGVNDTEGVEGKSSGAGGSGIVVISYPTDGSAGIYPTSTGGTITTSGGNTIHTFTSTGTFTAVTTGSTNTGNFFLFFN